jgi:hypothetical protein
MNLNNLEWDSFSLPECFIYECKECSYRTRRLQGGVYIIGANAPIEESKDPAPSKCPLCKKEVFARVDKESIISRFYWVIQNLYGFGKDKDYYPCTCNPQPKCRIERNTEVKYSSGSSDVFVSDRDWIRVTTEVSCYGCGATGKLAMLEQHSAHHLQQQDWVKNPKSEIKPLPKIEKVESTSLLPGKYGFQHKLYEQEFSFTFQTLNELRDFYREWVEQK